MLSEMQVRASQLLGIGMKQSEVIIKLGISRSAITRWRKLLEFREAVRKAIPTDGEKSDAQLLILTKQRIAGHIQRGEKIPRELATVLSSLNKKKRKPKKIETLLDGLHFEDDETSWKPKGYPLSFKNRRTAIEYWMTKDPAIRKQIEQCCFDHDDLEARKDCVTKIINGGSTDEEVMGHLKYRMMTSPSGQRFIQSQSHLKHLVEGE